MNTRLVNLGRELSEKGLVVWLGALGVSFSVTSFSGLVQRSIRLSRHTFENHEKIPILLRLVLCCSTAEARLNQDVQPTSGRLKEL
jgi:hypothetical protein